MDERIVQLFSKKKCFFRLFFQKKKNWFLNAFKSICKLLSWLRHGNDRRFKFDNIDFLLLGEPMGQAMVVFSNTFELVELM